MSLRLSLVAAVLIILVASIGVPENLRLSSGKTMTLHNMLPDAKATTSSILTIRLSSSQDSNSKRRIDPLVPTEEFLRASSLRAQPGAARPRTKTRFRTSTPLP